MGASQPTPWTEEEAKKKAEIDKWIGVGGAVLTFFYRITMFS
jgi:hypothetical protein